MQRTPFTFQKPEGRPFLFTSFVQTMDGKIIVKEKGYWPIGTKEEYAYFTFLRAHADAIVDAKNTAKMFGKYTIKTLHDETFRGYRSQIGKTGIPDYIVLTSSPDAGLAAVLKNERGYRVTVLTSEQAAIDPAIQDIADVKSISDQNRIAVSDLIDYFNTKGYQHVFIDGGPTLIAQLLQANVLDEVHLTIAPKIFGSAPGKTLTMTEGILFPPDAVPQFKLISVEKLQDEVILRYHRLTR